MRRSRAPRGRLRLAVAYGHNKDHRLDLKPLLDILTVSGDGAVPVHAHVGSGNATADRSNRATRDPVCKLIDRRNFRDVADCKLATTENIAPSTWLSPKKRRTSWPLSSDFAENRHE